jgi:hypothetical protein
MERKTDKLTGAGMAYSDACGHEELAGMFLESGAFQPSSIVGLCRYYDNSVRLREVIERCLTGLKGQAVITNLNRKDKE